MMSEALALLGEDRYPLAVINKGIPCRRLILRAVGPPSVLGTPLRGIRRTWRALPKYRFTLYIMNLNTFLKNDSNWDAYHPTLL